MRYRWGCVEADDEDDLPDDEPASKSDDSDIGITGQDADGVLTIAVNDTADVLSVSLAREWKRSVDPRNLHASVVTAMNAATMHVLELQIEQVDLSAHGAGPARNHRGLHHLRRPGRSARSTPSDSWMPSPRISTSSCARSRR